MNLFCFISCKPALTEEPSKEPGDQKNREYFKRQKLHWLRSYLLEKGIQIPSDGKNKSFLQVSLLSSGTLQVQLSEVFNFVHCYRLIWRGTATAARTHRVFFMSYLFLAT